MRNWSSERISSASYHVCSQRVRFRYTSRNGGTNVKVCVVGVGYVGLVSAVCYALMGHSVNCVDVDHNKIELLRQGKSPIHESGLEDIMNRADVRPRLTFDTERPSDPDLDIVLLAVGTPPLPNGAPDLRYIFTAVEEAVEYMPPGCVLAVKSTVPVGTGDRVEKLLSSKGRSDVSVCSFPEFLREGSAVEDTLHPSRLVFGVQNLRAEEVLRTLHEDTDAPVVVCERRTAEMVKYSSNAFLATKISFINEIANICDIVGADVKIVSEAMGYDSRIGREFLRPGLGYGGSCFPKDTRALVKLADDVDYDFRVLKSVVELNQRQRSAPLRTLREWFGDISDRHFAILGVAFKPGTDDIRESPALDLAWELISRGGTVAFSDPIVSQNVTVGSTEYRVSRDPYEALRGADAGILVTEWQVFRELDWKRVRDIMRNPYIFDGRNVLDPDLLTEEGIVLRNIGRGLSRRAYAK